MDEGEWVDNLQEKKVKEFSFFPWSFTRMEKEREIELPDIDLDSDDKKEDDTKKDTPGSSTVKTVTLTIGGLAIGIVVGASAATLANQPTSCTPVITKPTTQTSVQTSPTPTRSPAVPGGASSGASAPATR